MLINFQISDYNFYEQQQIFIESKENIGNKSGQMQAKILNKSGSVTNQISAIYILREVEEEIY